MIEARSWAPLFGRQAMSNRLAATIAGNPEIEKRKVEAYVKTVLTLEFLSAPTLLLRSDSDRRPIRFR
jgi:hypothetical protein